MAPRSTSTLSLLRHSEQDALEAFERLNSLDERLGEGCGATKERDKLTKIVESWMQEEEATDGAEDRDSPDEEEFEEEDDCENDHEGAYIDRHGSDERVAVFGGDPTRRRQSVEKRMQPYKSLDQFGTPRDVGRGDQQDLCKKIKKNSFDVVYIWTRFGNHSSRRAIREACRKNDTRCVEIESLSRLRKT